jgi:ADP-heptose:LPS heptosyltransferase
LSGVSDLSDWTKRILTSAAIRMLGGKNSTEPFSLGRLASSARRVLVVPPEGLAEMLQVYPAMTLLRGALPESRLICLVEGGQAEILRGNPIVDDMVEFPKVRGTRGIWKYRAFLSELRERMIEAVFYFDFRYDFYKVMLPLLSGARLRVRLKGDIGYPLFNVEVIPAKDANYFEDLNLSLVRFLASGGAQTSRWQLPEKETKIAREVVKLRKKSPADLMIGVDLSYTKSGDKPPFDVEIRIAKSLQALRPSGIALLSDPDPAIKDEDIRKLGVYDWLDIPRKSFRDTLGILSQCDLLIGPNTDLLHFAVTMGVPCLVLLSEKEDKRWIPRTGDFQMMQESEWKTGSPAKIAMQTRDFLGARSKVPA